jgi:subtilisin family serine protease
VVACADTGIDMDVSLHHMCKNSKTRNSRDCWESGCDGSFFVQHCFFRDRDRPVPFNAVDLQARKVVQYVMSWGDKTDFGGGHGTHVAGSIAGDTEEGAHEFAGMAPAAKLGALPHL